MFKFRHLSSSQERGQHCAVESLEQRRLLSAATFVYVESNNPNANAILAYQRNPSDGSLAPLSTASFLTGGKGFRNTGGLLGPDDSDHEIITSADGRFLYAVNQGSDSVSVFRIRHNGTLKLTDVIDSGGTQPVSLALSGDHLFVANRGDEAGANQGAVAPNYTAFNVHKNGDLSPVRNSTVTLDVGASPAILLSVAGGKLFANNFTAPARTADNNVVLPYTIGPDGRLTLAPGGAVGAPGLPVGGVLGLAKNPNQNILYAGLPFDGQVGVYSYDNTGKLTFHGAVGSGEAAACWLTVSADGKCLYVADSALNAVAVFSLANPLQPVEIQKFALQGPTKPAGATGDNQTVNFQLALDPTGQWLYVVNHATNDTFQQGNVIHTLDVNADGTLAESVAPLAFPADLAPATAHPQGIAIVSIPGGRGEDEKDNGNGKKNDAGDNLQHPFSFIADLPSQPANGPKALGNGGLASSLASSNHKVLA